MQYVAGCELSKLGSPTLEAVVYRIFKKKTMCKETNLSSAQ